MLVQMFRRGPINSRPSTKCELLINLFVCLWGPAMRHRWLYGCHRWMNVEWILDDKGECIFRSTLVKET